jgi:hypothetical protein
MKNAITNILTNTDSRGSVAVEKTLIQEAGVASPWAD